MINFVIKVLCMFSVVKYACSVDTEAEERLRTLDERLEKQELLNTRQEETVRRLEQTCQRQEETIRKQDEKNNLQDDIIKYQENEIRRLKNRVFEVFRYEEGTRNPENYTISGTQKLKKSNSRRTLARVSRQYERVAFSSYADHNLQNLGIDHPIVYNQVLLNEGSAYNEHSGMFTCPMDGIYAFYFSVSTQDINQIVAKLVVDGINQVDGVSDTFHDNHEAQGGNFVVMSLKKGQQVWVANYRWTTHSMQESDIYRFSSFSGFLLY